MTINTLLYKYFLLCFLILAIGVQELSNSSLLGDIDMKCQMDLENDTQDNDLGEDDSLVELFKSIQESRNHAKIAFQPRPFLYSQSVLANILVPPPDLI